MTLLFNELSPHLPLFEREGEQGGELIKSRQRVALIHLFFLVFTSTLSLAQTYFDSLAIEVTGQSREFAYTNKESAFFYGETNSDNTSSWMGFNVFGHEFLDDYRLIVDGQELKRTSAIKSIVYPDYITRIYPGGITEQFRPADSLALFSLIITSPKPVELAVVPLFTDGRTSQDFRLTLSDGMALIGRSNHPARTPEQNYPVWLAIHGKSLSPVEQEYRKRGQYSPIAMVSTKSKTHIIVFSVGDTQDEAAAEAQHYMSDPAQYFSKRRARMEKLLKETEVRTENRDFDKALAWAKLSLDALIMNQVTKGIFAGLPWFNNYWGRDTFISLPGACLVTGHFAEAKKILRSFAAFQERDSNSNDYGRIPNIVTTTDKAYNTADGTPRFVMMTREYIERSGDSSFMLETYPVILRSIDGTLKYHSDSLGFLVHGDAETWMDAVGPDGPWSPRGNRANDIQALWARQLEAGVWFATQLGDATSARRWYDVLQKLKANFTKDFVSGDGVVDHLNTDGSTDKQLRPNQIFTAHLLDKEMRAGVLSTVAGKLTYEYGVASLSQEDDNFHPYHQFSTYPKDAAYHNGTVWTWVQGAVISELCHFGRQDLAWKVTENSVHQILDRGAVGTQSELLDGVPKPGEKEPSLSGTFSQAWNLAEFIRNFYDDYLGVRLTRYDHKLVLRPMLPKPLGKIKAVINLDGRSVPIEIDPANQRYVIDGQNLRSGGKGVIELETPNGRHTTTEFPIKPKSTIKIEVRDTTVTVWGGKVKLKSFTSAGQHRNHDSILESLTLAKPEIRSGLKALRGPDYPLITHSVIRSTNPSALKLVDVDDPAGDDTGVGASGEPLGNYTYPTNPFFVPGCLDITHFTINTDSALAYFNVKFKSLSNPGWHPEYGFQLTYVAIAIDQDRKQGSGTRVIPRNANFILNERTGYEKLILVGGGIRLEDSSGKILAAYVPEASDIANPLGNIETSTISFAVPLSYLGKPTKGWGFTVLIGGQDDHGGSGLGEFRTVNAEAGDWNGGGKTDPGGSNVYDMIETN